jgi:hypothetical protein
MHLLVKRIRIKKLIVNILNNDDNVDEDDYSKLNHIIKENVKAVLAKNKQMISV